MKQLNETHYLAICYTTVVIVLVLIIIMATN